MALLTRADLKWRLTCPHDHYYRLSDLWAGELRQMMRVSGFWSLFSNVVAPDWCDPYPSNGWHPPPWAFDAAKIDMAMFFRPIGCEYICHHYTLLEELATTRVASFCIRSVLHTIERGCRCSLQERMVAEPLPEAQLRLFREAARDTVTYAADLDRSFRALRNELEVLVGPWINLGIVQDAPRIDQLSPLRGEARKRRKSNLDKNITNCLMEAGKPSWCKGEYNPK